MSRQRWVSLLAPPQFESTELTERAATFHTVAWSTLLVVTALVIPAALLTPVSIYRAAFILLGVDGLALLLLWLNHLGRTRLAGVLLVAGLVATVSLGAIDQGGVRSPGIATYVIFPLMAGVLLGTAAGYVTAALCVVLTFTFVVLEAQGILPDQTIAYSSGSLGLLYALYIGLALGLIRLGTSAYAQALARAERELAERRDTERRLALAMEAGGIGTWEQNVLTGDFQADPKALEMFGLSHQPLVTAERWASLIHQEDRAATLAANHELLQGAPHASAHYRILRPDGVERYIEAAGMPLRNRAGAIERIVGLVLDRTDERRAHVERERLLNQLGERVKELRLLHAAARLVREGQVTADVLSELVRQFPGAMQFPALCEARIRVGELSASTPGWRESPCRLTTSFATRAGVGEIDVCYARAPGTATEDPFLVEERALLDSVAEMLQTTIDRDHAEREQRSLARQLRQSQKMDALGTLAGGIAHDFNNILTAIIGNASLALSEAPSGLVRECLDEVKKAGRRATDLVKRILLFSRRVESERKVMSIVPVIDEALALLRTSVPPGVRIYTQFVADLPPVRADATQIHQVLMNLGTNAAYAMRETGGQLAITVSRVVVDASPSVPVDLSPGEHVQIEVADSGSGIAPEILSRLFEPFFTTKGTEGTGLGLSVVHGIVREHDGAITVESEVGRGTTFRVYLPATVSAATSTHVESEVRLRGNGERILYVDDEEPLVRLATRALTQLGYRCSGCSDPEEALRIFRGDPGAFDAVITDMSMPGMTGLDLARRIRDLHATIPIVMASGYGDAAVTGDIVSARLPKPMTPEQLSQTLHQLLSTR